MRRMVVSWSGVWRPYGSRGWIVDRTGRALVRSLRRARSNLITLARFLAAVIAGCAPTQRERILTLLHIRFMVVVRGWLEMRSVGHPCETGNVCRRANCVALIGRVDLVVCRCFCMVIVTRVRREGRRGVWQGAEWAGFFGFVASFARDRTRKENLLNKIMSQRNAALLADCSHQERNCR
jgi:hypothetical protein